VSRPEPRHAGATAAMLMVVLTLAIVAPAISATLGR
jgi:hypothetical protein